MTSEVEYAWVLEILLQLYNLQVDSHCQETNWRYRILSKPCQRTRRVVHCPNPAMIVRKHNNRCFLGSGIAHGCYTHTQAIQGSCVFFLGSARPEFSLSKMGRGGSRHPKEKVFGGSNFVISLEVSYHLRETPHI